MKLAICFFVLLLSFSGSLRAENEEPTVKVFKHYRYGAILTDSKGMSLYMYRPDKAIESTCYDICTVTWPPLVTGAEPRLAHGVVGSLERHDRRSKESQVTYNGMPLYYHIYDKKPGDVRGHKVDHKWFLVNPDTKK